MTRPEDSDRLRREVDRANTAMIAALATEGYTVTDIAAELGLPFGYVHAVLAGSGHLR